jgi:hypothetical protein
MHRAEDGQRKRREESCKPHCLPLHVAWGTGVQGKGTGTRYSLFLVPLPVHRYRTVHSPTGTYVHEHMYKVRVCACMYHVICAKYQAIKPSRNADRKKSDRPKSRAKPSKYLGLNP